MNNTFATGQHTSNCSRSLKKLACALLCCLTLAHANGQQNTEDSSDLNDEKTSTATTITTTSTSEDSTDWGYRGKDQRGRIGMSGTKLPGKTKVMRSSTTINRTIDVAQKPTALQCESDIDLVYYQKDEETEVRTLFSSDNCDDFDATYQLRIMYFDSNGEIQRIVADEQWPAGRKEQLRKSYPMKKNSELRRVTSRILSCTCNP